MRFPTSRTVVQLCIFGSTAALVALAAAQTDTTSTVVTGRVTRESGKPVAGARVMLRAWSEGGGGGANGNTTTDAKGNYEIKAQPGTHRVLVQADGYAGMFRTHDVRSGLNRGWDFPLTPSASVRGKILDTNGQSQAGRAIELWPVRQEPPPAPGLEYWPASGGSGNGTTDDHGAFTLANAAPGYYRVIVYRPMPSADRSMQQIPLEKRFLEIKSGETIDDFVIRVNPPEMFAISGRVVDANGKPIERIGVDSFIPHGRHWWYQTTADGAFRIDGLDGIGMSRLRVYFNDIPGAESFKVYLSDVPVNTRDITFTIPGKGTIAGKAVNTRTNATVNTVEVSVPLVKLPDSGASWETPQVNIEHSGDGKFLLANVPAGIATVEVRAEGLGAQRFEVEVHADATTALDCRLRGAAIVEGNVTLDGKPHKTGIVIGDDWMSTDDAGHFRYDKYPNGPLTIWFFENDGWHRTATVNLLSGETVTQNMEMGGPGKIRGTIQYVDDGAFRTVRVAAIPAPDGWYEFGRPSPEEQVLHYTHIHKPGSDYRLDNIPVGRWHFMVGRYEPAMHRAVIVESRIVEIEDETPIVIDIVEQ